MEDATLETPAPTGLGPGALNLLAATCFGGAGILLVVGLVTAFVLHDSTLTRFASFPTRHLHVTLLDRVAAATQGGGIIAASFVLLGAVLVLVSRTWFADAGETWTTRALGPVIAFCVVVTAVASIVPVLGQTHSAVFGLYNRWREVGYVVAVIVMAGGSGLALTRSRPGELDAPAS